MTFAEVCSYLRGRLQMRVQLAEDGRRYLVSPLPRDIGKAKWDPECWDLPELCLHYNIPLWKVGLAPAPPAPAIGEVFIKPGTIPGEGEPCPKCGTIRPNNTPGACRSCDEAWDAAKRMAVEMGPAAPGTRPCMADGGGAVCTREQGHERIQGPAGDHAAHNLRGEMVKRWPALGPVAVCPSCEQGRTQNPCEHCGHVEGDKSQEES